MTIKEIAARAGVSAATVSYVINDRGNISDETRKKVEEIIKETGYQSNILARSLRNNRSNLIGIVVEDITVWHTPYIIDGINALAEKSGYHTVLSNLRLLSKIEDKFQDITKYQADIDQAIDILLAMQVDGLIYVGMHDRMIPHIIRGRKKEVVYCYCYTADDGSSVRYSNEKASYEITQEFIQKGHQEIAVFMGLENSEPARLRMQGIQSALQEAGLDLKPENIIVADWKFDLARTEAIRFLGRPDHPKAVIAMNDEMAMGIIKAAAELELKIPEDISVSGFDNADIAHYTIPRLVTVDRPLHEMGYCSMEILMSKIEKQQKNDISVTIPCSIIPGNTIQKL